jgi:hypothetical protein
MDKLAESIFKSAVAQLRAQAETHKLGTSSPTRCIYCGHVYSNMQHYPYCSLECANDAEREN